MIRWGEVETALSVWSCRGDSARLCGSLSHDKGLAPGHLYATH